MIRPCLKKTYYGTRKQKTFFQPSGTAPVTFHSSVADNTSYMKSPALAGTRKFLVH